MSDALNAVCGKRKTISQGYSAICQVPSVVTHEWHEDWWETGKERVIWRDDVKFVRGGELGAGLNE